MKTYLYALRVWLYTQFANLCLHYKVLLKLQYPYSARIDNAFKCALDKLQKELNRR